VFDRTVFHRPGGDADTLVVDRTGVRGASERIHEGRVSLSKGAFFLWGVRGVRIAGRIRHSRVVMARHFGGRLGVTTERERCRLRNDMSGNQRRQQQNAQERQGTCKSLNFSEIP
jgi:hypothetical protein